MLSNAAGWMAQRRPFHRSAIARSCPALRAEILRVLELLGETDPRALMRTTEPRYRELGLADATADELVAAMTQHPELVQRPVVIWADRAVIARPPELLLPLLETAQPPAAP
jgi:arsenate reductase (glutaredoxin)